MKLYGLKTCDTCRKAVKTLTAAGREVTLTDLRETPLSKLELERLYQTFGAPLLNTRSTTWRGLTEDERQEEPLSLLQKHPALMKRPVIALTDLQSAEGQFYLGWGRDVQEALL